MARIRYNSENNTIVLIGIKPVFPNRSLTAAENPETADMIDILCEGEAVYCAYYGDYLNADDGDNPFGTDVPTTIAALNAFFNQDETNFFLHIST